MRLIRTGEYVINLDLVTSCRLNESDGSIQIKLAGQEGTIALSGKEAQIIQKAMGIYN